MARLHVSCPACGASVEFFSRAAVQSVCAHCRSVVVASTKGIEAIGKVADLHDLASPIQVGTRGTYEGKRFEVRGRVFLEWEGGAWSEWYAPFEDGGEAWLAEAQGFWMFSAPCEVPEDVRKRPPFHEGARLKFGSEDVWKGVDQRRVRVASTEGELPLALRLGENAQSLDLKAIARPGEFITLSNYADGVQAYRGRYLEFEDLHLENLRPVSVQKPEHGGEPSKGLAFRRTLSCPSCGSAIELRVALKSKSVVCGSCHSILDLEDPGLQIIGAFQRATAGGLELPLGTKFKYRGGDWECLAKVTREDVASSFQWREFLFHDPFRGYRFLVESNGHYSWVTMSHSLPEVEAATRTARYLGVRYQLFHRGKARVVAVAGEVYWRLQAGETVTVEDYISPPYMLSVERSEDETTWSVSEYLPLERVKDLLKLPAYPTVIGVAANQPNHHVGSAQAQGTFVAALVLILGIQAWGAWFARPAENVLSFQRTFQKTVPPSPVPAPVGITPEASPPFAEPGASTSPSSSPSPSASPLGPNTYLSEPFNLRHESQWAELEVSVPNLQNSWADFEVELIGADGSVEEEGLIPLEYYSGYEGGESWSEGSRSGTLSLPSVDAGDYRLKVEPVFPEGVTEERFDVLLTAGGTSLLNLLFALLFISWGPLVIGGKRRSFEQLRWSDSSVGAPGSLGGGAGAEEDTEKAEDDDE